MSLPVVFWDGGWVIGAAPSLEDIINAEPANPQKRSSETEFDLDTKMQIAMERTSNGNSSNKTRKTKALVEAPVRGEVIAKDDKVVVTKVNGAIIIQERFVKKKVVKRKLPVRSRRRRATIPEKVEVEETVIEKPASILVPEMYAANLKDYLESLNLTGKAKSLAKRAVKLLMG